MNCAGDALVSASVSTRTSWLPAQCNWGRWLLALLMCGSLISTSGCVGMFVNLIHAGWGNRVEAQFKGLAGRRVAVVCISQNSEFGPSSAANEIARNVSGQLIKAVSDIAVVPRDVMDDWIDRNGWNEIDFRELGRGVNAELVVAINLKSFSLHDGKTLYKGKSDVDITVYDLTDGDRVVYEAEPPQIHHPKIAGIHTTDMSASEFRRVFIGVLSQRIARHFFAYDVVDEFGSDTTSIR